MRGATGCVHYGDTQRLRCSGVDVVETCATPANDLEVRHSTVHLGGDSASPAGQHGAYLVERKGGVQLERIRHHPHTVGSFEPSEGGGVNRFQQTHHLSRLPSFFVCLVTNSWRGR